MTDTSSVVCEKRGQAFWITINRPDKRNALNGDVVAGIPAAIATRMTTRVCASSS